MKTKIACIIIAAILLAFIWGNSMLPRAQSSDLSVWAMGILNKIFSADVTAEGSVEGAGALRKIAHFAEFCALGAVLSILFWQIIKDKRIMTLSLALSGVFVALFDETIQIFSGRGPLVSDVWLDISGYAVGCAIALAVVLLKTKISEKQ